MRFATGSTVISPELRGGLTIGFCGAFTTMSTFSYESIRLLGDGEYWYAGVYMGGTVLGCLAAVIAGAAVQVNCCDRRPHVSPIQGERTLMRIFIGESDKYQGKPLYEALLERLRAKGLAGATVLRGVAGFGASSVVHTEKVLRLSLDLPLIIEVVETEEAIQALLPTWTR